MVRARAAARAKKGVTPFVGLLAALLVAAPASPARADLHLDEHTTYRAAGYFVKGDGINYELSPGVYEPTVTAIEDRGSEYGVSQAPTAWRLSKADRTLYLTRGGRTVGLRPVGVYYLDRDSWSWTQAAALQVPSAVVNDGQVLQVRDLFPNVDMEVQSLPSGPVVDYVVSSKQGFPATPYSPDSTWVVFVHRLVLGADAPEIQIDEAPPAWTGIEGAGIRFRGLKNLDIVPSEAEDAHGDTAEVKNFLVERGGQKYFLEGVRYSAFLNAAYPVRLHYYTKGGTISSHETWVSGETYFVQSDVTVHQAKLTVEGGAFVKMGYGKWIYIDYGVGSEFVVTGTPDNPAYFVGCNNMAYGEDLSSETAQVCDDDTITRGFWLQIYLRNNGSIVGAFVDGSTQASGYEPIEVNTALLTNSTVTVKDCVVQNGGVGGGLNRGIMVFPSSGDDVLVEGNVVEDDGTSYCYYMTTTSCPNSFVVRNNLCLAKGPEKHGFYLNGFDSGCPIEVYNNTAVNTVSNTVSGFQSAEDNTAVLVNNVVVGFSQAFNSSYGGNDHHNLGYPNFPAEFMGGTDIEADPLFSTHAGDTFVPAWADDYHLGASSPAVDAGSDTAANLGLEMRHTSYTGANDTGIVDLGFHFLTTSSSIRHVIGRGVLLGLGIGAR